MIIVPYTPAGVDPSIPPAPRPALGFRSIFFNNSGSKLYAVFNQSPPDAYGYWSFDANTGTALRSALYLYAGGFSNGAPATGDGKVFCITPGYLVIFDATTDAFLSSVVVNASAAQLDICNRVSTTGKTWTTSNALSMAYTFNSSTGAKGASYSIPAAGSIASRGDKFWVLGYNASNIEEWDGISETKIRGFTTTGTSAGGLAVTMDGQYLYYPVTNGVRRYDLSAGTTLNLGANTQTRAVAVSNDGLKVYMRDSNTSVYVYEAATGVRLKTITVHPCGTALDTGRVFRCLAARPGTDDMYCANLESGTIHVIDTKTDTIKSTITVPSITAREIEESMARNAKARIEGLTDAEALIGSGSEDLL